MEKIKTCKKCQERNLNKDITEISYCEKCASNRRIVYKPTRVKPLADHLRDIMNEQNKTEMSSFNIELLEEAVKRSGSRTSAVNGSLLSVIMHTTRGKELFQDAGSRYFSSTCRFYKVYELKNNV